MDTLTNLFSSDLSTTVAGPQTALLAMLMCFCIGHIVAWVYMWTHDGLSYSKMFTMSLLAMPVIVALVMILMAGNIVIAVGLLAVFTVVRFRNVLKDTRDTTFVLWAIVEGMASGTLRFGVAILGCILVSLVFIYLKLTAFGGRHRYDVVVNLQWRGNGDSLDTLQPILWRHSVRAQLAGHRPRGRAGDRGPGEVRSRDREREARRSVIADRGPVDLDPACGYGHVLDIDGNETGLRVTSLSQEHGEISSYDDAMTSKFNVGDRVRILANHSCMTAAQHSHYNVLENGEIVDRWQIHNGW